MLEVFGTQEPLSTTSVSAQAVVAVEVVAAVVLGVVTGVVGAGVVVPGVVVAAVVRGGVAGGLGTHDPLFKVSVSAQDVVVAEVVVELVAEVLEVVTGVVGTQLLPDLELPGPQIEVEVVVTSEELADDVAEVALELVEDDVPG